MKTYFLYMFTILSTVVPHHAADVQFVKGKASAPVGASLSVGDAFSTRSKSQSQVGMKRSFFRVGSDSQVRMSEGQRIVMEKGVMLVGSEPGRGRETVEVDVPGYRMKVRGSVQIAYYPGQYLKVTVIEGKVTVALQSLAGEFEELEPGQMLIINPSDKRLPEPVEVDLSRIISTSQLIASPLGSPSTKGLMDAAAGAQSGDGNLTRTPLMFSGASPEMYLVDNAARGRVMEEERTTFQLTNDLIDPTANVDQKTYADGLSYYSFPFPPTEPGILMTRTGARTKELTVLLTSEPDEYGDYAAPATLHGTIRADSDIFSPIAGKKLLFESQEYAADPFNDFSLHLAAGTDILTPAQVGIGFLGAFGITGTDAVVQAGNSTHVDEVLDIRATEGDITFTQSTLAAYSIWLAGSTANTGPQQNITLTQTTATAKDSITLGSSEVRTRVTLQNSTQLAALLSHLTVQSKGAPITVDSSMLSAGGTLTLDARDIADAGANGLITLQNANLSADVIRVRASTLGGTGLLIDGGTFNADSLLMFFAGSSSTLLFRGNVTVNSPHAIFSGNTVQVEAGGSVNVSGQADVYSNNHLYNSAGYGTISAGSGLNAYPASATPSF